MMQLVLFGLLNTSQASEQPGIMPHVWDGCSGFCICGSYFVATMGCPLCLTNIIMYRAVQMWCIHGCYRDSWGLLLYELVIARAHLVRRLYCTGKQIMFCILSHADVAGAGSDCIGALNHSSHMWMETLVDGYVSYHVGVMLVLCVSACNTIASGYGSLLSALYGLFNLYEICYYYPCAPLPSLVCI